MRLRFGRAVAAALTLFVTALVFPGVAYASLVTSPAHTWGTNGRVLSILPIGDRIYVAGAFGKVVDTSGVSYPAKNIAVFSASTGRADITFDAGTNGTVNSLSTDGVTLYLGGMFSSVSDDQGTFARAGLAAVAASTGAVSGWAPSATGSSVDSVLYVTGTDSVYAAGNFSSVTGAGGTHSGHPYIAKIDATTGAVDTGFATAPDNRVRAQNAAVDGTGRLFIGGDFLAVSGALHTRAVTAVDAVTGAVDGSFVPGPTNETNLAPVYDIVSDSSRLYVGAAGSGGACTALSTADGSLVWTDHSNGNMQSVRLIGSTLYCGGHFSGTGSFLGVTREKLAAVDAGTGALLPFNPKINSSLGTWSLGTQAGDPNLYVGGDFTSISGVKQPHFAEFIDTTKQGPPQPPDDLLAQPGDTVVHLSWSVPSSDGGQALKNYKVYRSTTSGGENPHGSALAVLGPTATTYDDTAVDNGTTYFYQVVALNSLGASAPSNEASATPDVITVTPPGAPTSVAATNPAGEIDLSWNPPADNGGAPVTSYNVYRGTTPDGEDLVPYATGITTTSYHALYDLDAGATYYFKVSAVNTAGEGVVSTEVSAVMRAGKPGPAELDGSFDSGVVHLSWTVPPDGGTPILKYVLTRNGVKLASNIKPPQTWYDDATVVSGQTYVYQVKAVNAQGGGQQSNRYTVTIP